jgi:hypothetical protein
MAPVGSADTVDGLIAKCERYARGHNRDYRLRFTFEKSGHMPPMWSVWLDGMGDIGPYRGRAFSGKTLKEALAQFAEAHGL